MTTPLSPQQIQELVAGYVLGDLTSSEAEMFRRLLVDMPELRLEITSLQETLAMMPYGLDEVEPEVELRAQILSTAQAELSQPPAVSQKNKRLPLRLPWAMSTVAAGFAIALGLANLQLNDQVRSLQAQYPPLELTKSLNQGSMHQTWSGLSQLLQDHQSSLESPDGPVDFVVQQPGEILSLIQGFQTTLAALPLIPTKQGLLLGGSNCQLGETSGLRLTYQLKTNQTVSAYQLALAEEQFPEFHSAQLTLQQPDGTSIVLWRDEAYLYALVAELPTAELQNLAHAIEGT